MDKDFNASVNLEYWHPEVDYPLTVSYTGIACVGSNPVNGSTAKDSVKQEVNTEPI